MTEYFELTKNELLDLVESKSATIAALRARLAEAQKREAGLRDVLILARDELERIEQGTAWVDDDVLLKVYAACPVAASAEAGAGEG